MLLSTTEAEYIALSSATQEITRIRQLSMAIDPGAIDGATFIFRGNKSASGLIQTAGYRQKVKQIDIKHYTLVADQFAIWSGQGSSGRT